MNEGIKDSKLESGGQSCPYRLSCLAILSPCFLVTEIQTSGPHLGFVQRYGLVTRTVREVGARRLVLLKVLRRHVVGFGNQPSLRYSCKRK